MSRSQSLGLVVAEKLESLILRRSDSLHKMRFHLLFRGMRTLAYLIDNMPSEASFERLADGVVFHGECYGIKRLHHFTSSEVRQHTTLTGRAFII